MFTIPEGMTLEQMLAVQGEPVAMPEPEPEPEAEPMPVPVAPKRRAKTEN